MTRCPACATFERKYADVEVCGTCGLGRTTSALAPSDAQDYMADGEAAPAIAGRRRYFQYLHGRYLRRLPRGRALDVGCARGQFVEVLLEQGWDAYGLDAFRGARQDARFLRGTLDDLAPGTRFDLVTMVHTLEHMLDPSAELRKVAAVLAPRGLCMVIVPNFGGQWSRERGAAWPMLDTRNHAFHYTAAALSAVLAGAELAVASLHSYSGYMSSAWQRRLGARGFYDRGIGRLRPVGAAVFRFQAALRPLLNAIVDASGQGAELIALARGR